MKTYASLVAVLAAGTLLAPVAAAKFDSQKCKEYISGTWTSKPGSGGAEIEVTYDVGGTYKQGSKDAMASKDDKTVEAGYWNALPAGTTGCALALTPNGKKEQKFNLTVVDDDTVKADDGTVSHRTKGVMENSSP